MINSDGFMPRSSTTMEVLLRTSPKHNSAWSKLVIWRWPHQIPINSDGFMPRSSTTMERDHKDPQKHSFWPKYGTLTTSRPIRAVRKTAGSPVENRSAREHEVFGNEIHFSAETAVCVSPRDLRTRGNFKTSVVDAKWDSM
ncbi:unnamed protein product [Caenorhabditis auriculariae]|uniref:Uncharacterized protein n=1 Tax=Caenorhabditis auriculariae TaxID=2777116 RepID=A0A8S1HTU7_9PELO|nr:unnamed protein product [Caenorhabditis auriculariae]